MSESLAAHPIVFERFCFDGETFPACDFDQPDTVRAVVGPYTLKVAFYDAAGRPVRSAVGAGGCFLKVDPAYDMVLAHTRHTEDRLYDVYLKNRAKVLAAVIGSIRPGG